MTHMPKSVGVSFRLSKKGHQALLEEASRQNVSVNALLNKILLSYADADRFALRHHVMRLHGRPVLEAILEGSSEDFLEEAGRKLGKFHAREILKIIGLPQDSSSFLPFVAWLSKYESWFVYEMPEGGGGGIFHLRHEIGMKWTRFLKGYIASTAEALGLSFELEVSQFIITIKIIEPLIND